MWKKFWAALAALINNTQDLADTMREVDDQVRDKFGLEPRADDNSNQLEHKNGDDGPKKKLTKKGEDNE